MVNTVHVPFALTCLSDMGLDILVLLAVVAFFVSAFWEDGGRVLEPAVILGASWTRETSDTSARGILWQTAPSHACLTPTHNMPLPPPPTSSTTYPLLPFLRRVPLLLPAGLAGLCLCP